MKKQQQIADFLQMLHQCEGTIFHVCYKFTDRTPEAAADLYQEIVYCLNLKKVDTFGNNTKSKNETKYTNNTKMYFIKYAFAPKVYFIKYT